MLTYKTNKELSRMIYAFFLRWSSRHGSVVLTLSLELRAWPVTQADLSLCLSNTPCTHLNHTRTATASHRPCFFFFSFSCPLLLLPFPVESTIACLLAGQCGVEAQ